MLGLVEYSKVGFQFAKVEHVVSRRILGRILKNGGRDNEE